MAPTANLNIFHMLPKNCDRMPLANKWGNCPTSTEQGFIAQLGATAPLFPGLPGLPQRLPQPDAADRPKRSRDRATAVSRRQKRTGMTTSTYMKMIYQVTQCNHPLLLLPEELRTRGTGVLFAQPSSRLQPSGTRM